jgi:hypothetical protein
MSIRTAILGVSGTSLLQVVDEYEEINLKNKKEYNESQNQRPMLTNQSVRSVINL